MKFLFAFAALVVSAAAQANQTFPCLTETELDKQVPVCAQECQQLALHADGCKDYEDVACHCLATGVIGNILSPCLLNSTCTLDDLTALQNLINPVCQYFNATVNGAYPEPSCDKPKHQHMPSTPEAPASSSTPCESAPTITYTSWATPASTGYSATNATPSAPLQYWGNAASNVQVLGSTMLVAVGAVAAMLL